MQTVTLTHSGWFGICPVLLAIESIDGDEGMYLEPRWWWLGWLLTLSTWLQGLSINILCAVNHDYEPGWCAHGVRKLRVPVVMKLKG